MKKTIFKIFKPRADIAKTQARKYTRSKAGNFFFFLFLFLFGLFSVLPLIYCITTSLKPLDELMVFPPRLFRVLRPTFQNFTALPDILSSLSVPLSRYISNSLFISIAGTLLHVLVASMAAFVLSKSDLKHKNLIFIIVQFSLLFNTYTLAIPQYLIYTGLHVIDTFLVYLLPYIPSAMGVFLMKQYMDGYIPDAIIEAAHVDGSGWVRTFFFIVLPNIKPCLLTLILFSFRDLWAAVPAGTVFSENLKTLPTVVATIASGGIARSGSAMAATVIMMIPPITVYLISQGSVKESMSSAGIKG